MNFLADEDFPLTSTRLLRQAGHDVAAVIEDSPSTRDIENLARAVAENRYLLTFDRDFGELIYKLRQPAPPGIFYFRFVPQNPSEPAIRFLQLNQQTEVFFHGKFTVITTSNIRQRPLP